MGVNLKENYGDFDLIIVGSGPAGLSAAKQALRKGKRVINFDWGPHTFPNYSTVLRSSQVRSTGGLGGTALHWGGQFGTLSKFDKANWETVSGCDLDFFKRLEEAQKSICSDLGINFSDFVTDLNDAPPTQSLSYRDCVTLIPSEIDILRIFESTIRHPDYFFFPGKRLQFIEKHQGGSRTLHFDGETLDIGHVPLILATGCIETTRIIYESGIIKDQQVKNNFGAFLSDHPNTYGSLYKIKGKSKSLPPDIFSSGKKRKQEIVIYHDDLRLYQSGIFEIRREISPIVVNFFSKRFFKLENFVSLFFLIFFRREISRKLRTRYRLWYQIEQLRNSQSFITFESKLMTSHWGVSENDMKLFSILKQYGETEMKKYSVVKISSVELDQEFCLEQAFHPSGSLPFGLDPGRFTSNLYGKVFQIPNTWIASSALFPTAGWFNPSLVIMAFGYLAVEDIFKNEK